VDDHDVIQAFVHHGARRAFGPTLHVEGDALFLEGWWHAALRISPDTFIVRNEEPPTPSVALGQLTDELAARALREVGEDLPLIQPVTYVELSLGSVSWTLWAPDLPSGEQALAARTGRESFLTETSPAGAGATTDFSTELGGARRLAGLPPSVLLAVGLDQGRTEELQTALPDCSVEARAFQEITPDACGSLLPALVLVDATGSTGRDFIMELRASACGRFVPVAALTDGADVPLGAEEALDPTRPVTGWVETLRRLLP
jgi:hypothetical protein